MKLKLQVGIRDEERPDELPSVIGEVDVDLPKNVSTALAKSSRIASVIMRAANTIKQELERGRS